MRAPYKYPYLSIFILGYYFLEHEGYYYKLRNYFGYSETDEVNYVVSMTDKNFDGITKAPGRKSIVFFHNNKNQQEMQEFKNLARKAKENLRSALVFGEFLCEGEKLLCNNLETPSVLMLSEGNVVNTYSGPIQKKKLKKLLKNY